MTNYNKDLNFNKINFSIIVNVNAIPNTKEYKNSIFDNTLVFRVRTICIYTKIYRLKRNK